MTPLDEPSRHAVDRRIRAAVATGTAPEGAGPVANVATFGWRALLKIKHMPEQLFDVVVTPIMFTVIFTYLFGGALAGSPQAYLPFLLPGILVQTVIFTSSYTGVTLNTDISKGVYDRFNSMPIWRMSPIVGTMAGDVGRYTISCAIVIVIGLAMGYRPATGTVGIVLAVVLLNVFALGFGWIFVIIGLIVRAPSVVMTLSWMLLMPVVFLSNIYVDPATMPGWLQAIVAVNPVALVTTAARGILDGGVAPSAIVLALVGPAIITAVLAPVALMLYRRER